MNKLRETNNTRRNAGWRAAWALVSCALILASGICLHNTMEPPPSTTRTTIPQAVQTLMDSILHVMHTDSAVRQQTSTWTHHTLCNAFSISIPPTLEKREPWHEFTKTHPQANADVVFQQKGLSDMTDEAMSQYCRILVSHYNLSPDDEEVLKYDETEPIDTDMRSILLEMAEAECNPPYDMIGDPTYKWIDINGIKALETKYRRHGFQQDYTTAVAIYLLFNYDEMAKIIVAYREQERDLWQADLDYVIQTFRWKQLNR